MIQERFIARVKQVFRGFVRRVHCKVPPGVIWHGWQVKVDRLSAGIEQEK